MRITVIKPPMNFSPSLASLSRPFLSYTYSVRTCAGTLLDDVNHEPPKPAWGEESAWRVIRVTQ